MARTLLSSTRQQAWVRAVSCDQTTACTFPGGECLVRPRLSNVRIHLNYRTKCAKVKYMSYVVSDVFFDGRWTAKSGRIWTKLCACLFGIVHRPGLKLTGTASHRHEDHPSVEKSLRRQPYAYFIEVERNVWNVGREGNRTGFIKLGIKRFARDARGETLGSALIIEKWIISRGKNTVILNCCIDMCL